MHRVRAILEWFCAAALVLLIALTAADVFGRYALNSPIPGAFEYVRALMGLLIFAGLPLVSERREHLSAALLEHLFSARANRVRQPLIDLFCVVALAVLTWRLAAEALDKKGSGEVLPGVDIPLWGLIAFMVAMSAAATVVTAFAASRRS